MLHNPLILIFLLIFTAPVFAEVYKCDDDGVIRYSTTPCNKQILDLELGEDELEPEYNQEEQFITPVYPGWKNGWKKTKDLKLERFFEIVYEPIQPSESEKLTQINHQKLTNLPQSMSVQRFAISVEDIIESICASAFIYQPKTTKKLSNKVFYGQYACSFRRDTKQGELGYYKIMRGENSIYMLAVKWSVEPFLIELDKPIAIINNELQKKKISAAEKYLQNKVKLCTAGTCL